MISSSSGTVCATAFFAVLIRAMWNSASPRLTMGSFVEVNCATLRGDQAMSALFGHVKGAFTGAQNERAGLLSSAHQGVLFMDEIGELGADEQAMCLRAIEEKKFLRVGADKETQVDFQLIAGTNHDLSDDVRKGKFRDDLLARLNLWTFELPPLRERKDDIEPNLDYELREFSDREGSRASFNREAREQYVTFALSHEAAWTSNFRDLSASVTRMATLAPHGRIDEQTVRLEIEGLRRLWRTAHTAGDDFQYARKALTSEAYSATDLFDLPQLEQVIITCIGSSNLSEAGRKLFAASRQQKSSTNDADRLRKYLQRFDLRFEQFRQLG
jgi:transcriptional regulatory protein RtcR